MWRKHWENDRGCWGGMGEGAPDEWAWGQGFTVEGFGGVGFFPKVVPPFLAQLPPPKDVQPSALILDATRFAFRRENAAECLPFSVTGSESWIKSEGSFFFFFFGHAAGILVPWPGSNLCPLQWKRRVLTNHWTTREVPCGFFCQVQT